MENVSFEKVWQLLTPEGEYCRRRRACERLWNSFSAEKQQSIYRVLQRKTVNGDYLSVNPYYAIDDNNQPVFLNGLEQDRTRAEGIAMVLVKYHGRFLVCTEETRIAYGLEEVRKV